MGESVSTGDVVGAIVLAFGAAIAAFGDTLVARAEDDSLKRKGIEAVTAGSLTEATGNFLQTKARLAEGDVTIDAVGSAVQGVGNVINTLGGYFLLQGLEQKGLQVDFVGDTVQIIGAALETIGALESDYTYRGILAVGEALQAYGAAIEAYGNVLLLSEKEKEGERTQAFGSQLLFIGTVISAEVLAFEQKRAHKKIATNAEGK